jgi:hypothetical protein
MFRKLAAALSVALLLVIAAVVLLMTSALTVTVGAGAPVLVQNGAIQLNGGGGATPVTATLATASTQGTCLVAVLLTAGGTFTTGPSGWTQAETVDQGGAAHADIWLYPNNPGGILAATWQMTTGTTGIALQISEWSGVASTSTLDSGGTATSTAGTTLSPASTGNVSAVGEVAVAGWIQMLAAPGTVTFTTPTGWTRLQDTGALSALGHVDYEYIVNPPTGTPLTASLTSTGTSAHAAGAVVVLKGGTPAVDETAYLTAAGPIIKKNSCDFGLHLGGYLLLEDGGRLTLEDGSGYLLLDTYVPQLGDPVTVTNPTWSGRVVSVLLSDEVDRITNYRLASVTATNQTADPGGTAPGDLTDGAVSGGYLLLEDGGKLILEDGSGFLLLEGTTFNYRNLSRRQSQNVDGTTTTYGQVTVYQGGFQAGQTFLLTSQNFGYSSQPFTITNVTTSFVGLSTPVYLIEFGDAYQTLKTAGGGVLTQQASVAAVQQGVVVPAGTLGYAAVTASQTGITTITDLTGLSVTVTVVSGRRIEVRGYVRVAQNTSNGLNTLSIREGTTVLAQANESITAGSYHQYNMSVILQPTAGVHTYTLSLATTAGTTDLTSSGSTDPAYVVAEDIGT